MRSTSGTTCCHFFCSAVFSIPVCRYPMVGMHDLIVSPSSSSTRRSTPCVLGCCGPMLTVIVSVRSSAIGLMRPFQAISLDVRSELMFADFKRLVGLHRFANLHGIVLPRRMPFPVFGHEQPPQVAMPREDDPKHVPHLALGPPSRWPHALDGRHDAVDLRRRDADLHTQPHTIRDREPVIHDLEARLARQ